MYEILDAINPLRIYVDLVAFFELGGNVLVAILAATFVMWVLIIERYWYFWTSHGSVVRKAKNEWQARTDHKSWHAHRIRELLISEIRLETQRGLELLKTMVAIAPLLGLLGTVVGMVEVFDVLSLTGSSNARALASGVSKATLPTMAGMVASLSGLFFSTLLEDRAKREVEHVEDELELQ